MNKLILAACAAFALTVAPLSASPTINDLTNGLSTFTNDVPKSLPFAAGSGIDWSNAYIGNLLNTDFPFVHFGLGASLGATTIPADSIKPLVTSLGESFGMAELPLPFVAISGRVGGLVLPFDVGFKVGFVPSAFSTIDGYNLTYSNWGVDVRYNLIKSDILMPDVSVGVGVSGMSAGVSKSLGSGVTYTDASLGTLNIAAPKLSLDLSSIQYEAKAQVSKTFLAFLTPYLGLGVGYGTGDAKAGVASTITPSGSLSAWTNKYGVNFNSGTGFSKSNTAGVFSTRIYGGTSFDILVLKLDVQGEYSILDQAFGGSVGARIQF